MKKIVCGVLFMAMLNGNVFAMPQGGQVVVGDVTNVNNPDQVMVANKDSIINRNSFNIAKNETVRFDTNKYTVLNKVLSGQETQIFGGLIDSGNGHLIIMNTSGITIGGNAIIDANRITFTTLKMENEDELFRRAVEDCDRGGSGFEDDGITYKEDHAIPKKKLNVKGNVYFNARKDLYLYGGIVNIADGVQIVMPVQSELIAKKGEVRIGAGKTVNHRKTNSEYFSGDGNDVNIRNTLFGDRTHNLNTILVFGDNINIEDTEMSVGSLVSESLNPRDVRCVIAGKHTSITNTDIANYIGDIYIMSTNFVKEKYNDVYNKYYYDRYNHSDNVLNINNSTVYSANGDTDLSGYSININDSALSAKTGLNVCSLESIKGRPEYGKDAWDGVGDSRAIVNIDKATLDKSEYFGYVNVDGFLGNPYGKENEYAKEFKKNTSGNSIIKLQKRINIPGVNQGNLSNLFDKILSEQFTKEEIDRINKMIETNTIIDENDNVILIKKYNIFREGTGYAPVLVEELNEIQKHRDEEYQKNLQIIAEAERKKELKQQEEAAKKIEDNIKALQQEVNSQINELNKPPRISDAKLLEEVKTNVKLNIPANLGLTEKEKSELEAKIYKQIRDNVKDSLAQTKDVISSIQGLLGNLNETYYDYYKDIDIEYTFSNRVAGVMNISVKLNKKEIISPASQYFTSSVSPDTFMKISKEYGEETCQKVLYACAADVTTFVDSLADPSKALQLWKQCGGKDVSKLANKQVEAEFKGVLTSKAQKALFDIICAIVPNAGNIIANILGVK